MVVSASCILLSVTFYQQPPVTTIAPYVVAAGLKVTCDVMNGAAGIASPGCLHVGYIQGI